MNNQVKLIDRNKILNNLMEYIDTFKDDLGYAFKEGDEDHVNEISNKIELLQVFVDAIMAGAYKPDTPPVPTIKPGDKELRAAKEEIARINCDYYADKQRFHDRGRELEEAKGREQKLREAIESSMELGMLEYAPYAYEHFEETLSTLYPKEEDK